MDSKIHLHLQLRMARARFTSTFFVFSTMKFTHDFPPLTVPFTSVQVILTRGLPESAALSIIFLFLLFLVPRSEVEAPGWGTCSAPCSTARPDLSVGDKSSLQRRT